METFDMTKTQYKGNEETFLTLSVNAWWIPVENLQPKVETLTRESSSFPQAECGELRAA